MGRARAKICKGNLCVLRCRPLNRPSDTGRGVRWRLCAKREPKLTVRYVHSLPCAQVPDVAWRGGVGVGWRVGEEGDSKEASAN